MEGKDFFFFGGGEMRGRKCEGMNKEVVKWDKNQVGLVKYRRWFVGSIAFGWCVICMVCG